MTIWSWPKAARWLVILAILLSRLAFANAARAATLDQSAVSLGDAGLGDQTLFGNTSSQVFFLPGPGPVDLAGGSLELHFSHATTLNPQHSDLSISINDEVIASIALTQDNAGDTRLSLPFPSSLLKRDLTSIGLVTSLTKNLVSTDCSFSEASAMWIKLYSDTRVVYQSSAAAPLVLDLKDFPTPFSAPWLPQPAALRVAVPASSRPAILGETLTFVGNLGRLAGGRPTDLRLSTLDQLAGSPENVVALGLAPDLVELGAPWDKLGYRPTTQGWDLPNGSRLPAGQGLVVLMPSPWQEGRALLIVSGSDDIGLAKAAEVFATPTSRATLTGNVAIIAGGPSPNDLSGNLENSTLASLGYDDQNVGGDGIHDVSYRVPLSQQQASGATLLQLHLRASPLMQAERSSVEVAFNGKTLESLRLPTAHPDRIDLAVDVPPGAAHAGFNTLSLKFWLYVPYIAECGPVPNEQIWATILNSSAIQATTNPTTSAFDLSALPFPLVGAPSPILFVLPDSPSDWSPLLKLAFEVGRDSQQPVSFDALTASQFTPQVPLAQPVALYGTPTNNRWIAAIASTVPIALDLSRQRLVDNRSGKSLQVFASGQWGLIELAPSPWSADQPLLLIAGSDPEAADWAANATTRGGLTGPAVAVTGPTTTAPMTVATKQASLGSGPDLTRLAIVGSLPLVLLALLLLGWGGWTRSRSKR